MKEIILLAIVAIISIMLVKYLLSVDKFKKWFYNLKPGDKILVKIYSNYCDCYREATVTKSSDNKLISAKMDDVVYNKCKECALFKSKNDKGEVTCYYDMTKFTKQDVSEIE
jgi:hypothetical protein